MKKFILGFISACVLVGLIYFGYPIIRGFFGGSGGPVSPSELNPEVKDFGILRVEVFGKGQPIADVAVDLGKIGPRGPEGAMSEVRTDVNGVALFENVPVGVYDIFWNLTAFPQEYNQPATISVEIKKGQTTQKRINLTPKQ